MKGGSLTRFKPDPQDGGGFVQELLKASVMGGLKGLKSGRGVRRSTTSTDQERISQVHCEHGSTP